MSGWQVLGLIVAGAIVLAAFVYAWPLLLVAYGVLVLAEKLAVKYGGAQRPGAFRRRQP